CFLEKVAQRDILARARLHQFPVFAKNIAEYYVAEIGRVTFTPTDLENLFEMQSLRRANYVPNRVGFQIVDAIIDCRDIRRRIIKAAVPFPDDQGFISKFGNISEENDHRTFADLSDAAFEQAIYDGGQPIVIKTFAALEVVVDVEQLVTAF